MTDIRDDASVYKMCHNTHSDGEVRCVTMVLGFDAVFGMYRSWRYHSLNATVAQLKNSPFGVNTAIELKAINNNKIQLNSVLSKQFQNITLES